MAIIYSYPSKGSVASGDLFVISDASDNNKTKQVTAGSILSYIDGNMSYDLQQVLNSGSSATANNQTWPGSIRLTGISGSPQTAISLDTTSTAGSGTASIFANNGDLELQGLTNGGSVIARAAQLSASLTANTGLFNSTLVVSGKTTIGNVASITGNPDLKVGNSIKFGGGIGSGSAFTIGSGYDGLGTSPSDFTGPSIQFASSALSILNKGTGAITIGRATTPASSGVINIGDNNTTQLVLQSTDTGGNIRMQASDGVSISNTTSGDVEITNFSGGSSSIVLSNGIIRLATRTDAESTIDFLADNGIRLNGVSGAAGELIKSQGPGLPLVWTGSDDLEVLSAKKIIVNARTTTGPIAIGDPLYISDVEVGNRFTVSKADASDPLKMPVVGLAVEAVAGATGNFTMIVNGDLAIDTGTIPGTNPAALNNIIYVAPTGGLTTDRPTAVTDLVQNVGVVSDTGTNGAIKVSAIGRTNDTPNIISNTRQFQVTDNRGTNNVTFGQGAFANAGVAQDCVAIGVNAGQAITDALSSSNVAIGKFSMDGSAVGERNIAIGVGSLGSTNNQSADNNIAIGDLSLNSLTTAAENTFVGSNSGFNVTTGSLNTGIGKSALSQVSTGVANVALGYNTGNTVTGDENTIIGTEANAKAGTNKNVFIGRRASGATGHGDNNIVIGSDTETDGTRSIVIGPNLTLASTTPDESNKSIVIGNYIDSQNGASATGVGGSITIGTGESTTSLNNLAQNGIHIGITSTSSLGLTANADGSVGIGSAVLIDSSNAIAVGAGSSVDNLSRDSIAIGTLANVAASSRDGIAIGQATAVTGANGIAIGASSSAAQSGTSVGSGAVTAGDGVAIGRNAGTAPSGSVGGSIMIGDASGSGTTNGIAIGNTAEVGAHQEGVAIGTGAKTGAAHDVALGGIDMTTLGAPTGVGAGGTLGIGVRQAGTPVGGAFQSQAPVAQIPVKYPDGAGNLVTGHIYIYP